MNSNSTGASAAPNLGQAQFGQRVPERNLLIVHTPHAQDMSDWLEVRRRVIQTAPDIDVRIATNGLRNSVTRRWQSSRPSLVFSAFLIRDYQPPGGAIYACSRISKFEQIERLARAGLPVPLTARLSDGFSPDPAQWGRYVVVKPAWGGGGRNIHLLRIEEVATRYHELTENGAREMMIQPHIEHCDNGYPTECRVLTLFGKALYATRNRWAVARGAIDDIASTTGGIIASNFVKQVGRVRAVCNDPDIIAIGERAHAAFPECAVLGVDIVRDTTTGATYVMEVNPEGDTWHLSSDVAKARFPKEHVRDIYAQFDALARAADLLIEKTRAHAV